MILVHSQKLRQMYQNCTNVEGVLSHSQKSSEQLVIGFLGHDFYGIQAVYE